LCHGRLKTVDQSFPRRRSCGSGSRGTTVPVIAPSRAPHATLLPQLLPGPIKGLPPCLRSSALQAPREMPIDSFLPLAPGAAAAVPGNRSPLSVEGR